MNKIQSRNLLKIINEEIELFLEQPVDPNAPPDGKKNDAIDSEEDKELQTLKKWQDEEKLRDDEIRKKIQNGIQEKKQDIFDIIRYVLANQDNKEIPLSVKDIIISLVNQMDLKIPPKQEENQVSVPTAAPPAAPTPMTESRLQKAMKEYLYYKKMYLRSK